MVRGRRVRAVVACAPRNDDCCSPNPKRKDQGDLIDKILETPTKNQNIMQYFNKIVSVKEEKDAIIGKENTVIKSGLDLLIEAASDLDDKEKEEFKEIFAEPVDCNDCLSPSTPHRIQLQEDDEKLVNIKPKKLIEKVNKVKNTVNAPNSKVENHKLTEYFPVRRSNRRVNKIVLEEKQRNLRDIIRKGVENGLKVENFGDKGRGVVTSKLFQRDDFVVEYAGDLIDISEAKQREIKYAQDQNTGCYMYYFKHKGQQYCIDATAETGRLGRLVNHSRNGNLVTKIIDVDNKPRLVLLAKDTIEIGEEVTYDYGDRSKESLQYHPWLAY